MESMPHPFTKKAEAEWTVSQTRNKGFGSLYVGQNVILHLKNPTLRIAENAQTSYNV